MAHANNTYLQAPSEDDWDYHRPTIERLYIDEDKNLKDVMDIMSKDHGHRGTVKMYKSRFTKWNLAKNNRNDDMQFILHKKNQRDAVGKQTRFRVRGKVVPLEEVERYFKRKVGVSRSACADPQTPPHISYRSPSPNINPSDAVGSLETPETLAMEPWVNHNHFSLFTCEDWVDNSGQNEVFDNTLVTGNFDTPVNDSRPAVRFLQHPMLLPSDRLSFLMNTYLENQIQTGHWSNDKDGWLVSSNTQVRRVENLNKFASYIDMSVREFDAKANLEARRNLSHACSLVKGMLEEESPNLMGTILHSYLHFDDFQYQEVCDAIRKFVRNMAIELKIHLRPHGEILCLLGAIPADEVKDLILQAWNCLNVVLERNLGRFHLSRLDYYFQFVEHVIGVEKLHTLQQFMNDSEHLHGESSLQTLSVMWSLCGALIDERRYETAETMATKLYERAFQANLQYFQSEGLYLAACAKYEQGKIESALDDMRSFIDIEIRPYGAMDPIVISYLIQYGTWLRAFGKIEEADDVHEIVQEALGQDESDCVED